MKWLGAVLIVLCATWIGFERARRLAERPRQLRQLKVALQSLEAEMLYGHTPLAKASDHIASQLSPPISGLFSRFAENLRAKELSAHDAWALSIQGTWSDTALGESEREVLSQFGATLGTTDRHQQQKQLLLTQTHLEREEDEAKELQKRYEQMAKTLGVLAGLLIVILLI
ncbi:stage III sporulation protein SpoIIIAB [Shouchella shacheensis]|uniref:stage III sporulation protein SpoIIIAB n=1 Tax=Shouchella shacheensis TaxID=1649580 RepID=UPI00074000FB|nr:stage III sporulation protein SpoIIIAB [Shouchella shacheensis]